MRKKYFSGLVSAFMLSALMLSVSCGEKEKKTKEQITISTKKKVVKKEPGKKLSAGEKNFLLCAACHNLKKGEPHKVGPSLYGVFGRKAGTAEGFNYSDAVKNSGIVWSEETIKNWLTKPTDYIPGTTMAFIGLKDEKQQDALIAYLKEMTKQ